MSDKSYDARDYNKKDDIYWEVSRKFANVSNYTYGPYSDWDEKDVNTSVDYLRKAIQDMIGDRIKTRELTEKVTQIANNVIYFDDSSDYRTALWEILSAINPEKYDGIDEIPEYIEDKDE